MEAHENFLNFKGKNIFFLNKDGEYYVAIKPICEALNVDHAAQLKRIKRDPFLGAVWSKQTIQTTFFRQNQGAVIQGMDMVCFPEKYIYGWIFSINSDSPELLEYKKQCYDLLYNHFHGIITGRKRLLFQRLELEERLDALKTQAKEQSPIFTEMDNLLQQRKKINKQLYQLDKKVLNQTEIQFN
jgi:hypothetical protein